MPEEHPDRIDDQKSASQAPQTAVAEKKPLRASLPGLLANFESPLFHEIAPAFGDPVTKLKWFWRKDLASKVFLITMTALLVASVLFAFSATTFLSQLFPRTAQHLNMTPEDELKISGTVDPHPTFAVNYGKNGTRSSSLPPKSGTVATTSGTPTSDNLQITDIPDEVDDGDSVHVTVTGQPGTTVRLTIQYNTDPYYAESSSRTIDSDGEVTLTWKVDISAHGKDNIVAQVTAVSGNGQSGTVTVQVNP